jgi:hypothetical protein
VKKNKADEPNHAVIHIHMEVPQENSLCSYLKQAKLSFFFSFIKSENRIVEQILSGGLGPVQGEGCGERV